jgi:broad specificity phosphatase PhoE
MSKPGGSIGKNTKLICFIRHGARDRNPGVDKLTPEGALQVNELGKAMESLSWFKDRSHLWVSSNMRRTLVTESLVSGGREGRNLLVLGQLNEWGPAGPREGARGIARRISGTIRELVEGHGVAGRYPKDVVPVVVTHCGVINVAAMVLLGLDPCHSFKLDVAEGSLSVLAKEGGHWRVKIWGWRPDGSLRSEG